MVTLLTTEESSALYTKKFNSLNSGCFFRVSIGGFENDRLFMVINRESDKILNVLELSTNENKYCLQKGIPLNVSQYHFNANDYLNIVKIGNPIDRTYENTSAIEYCMNIEALENYYTNHYNLIVDHIRSDFGRNNGEYWLILYFDRDEIKYDYSECFGDIYEQLPNDCKKWLLRKKLIV